MYRGRNQGWSPRDSDCLELGDHVPGETAGLFFSGIDLGVWVIALSPTDLVLIVLIASAR